MIYGYARASTDGQTAKVEGDRHVIEGDPTGGDGRASLFIDRFGFGGSRAGFGRVGYGHAGVGRVGVWNRPYVARGAWYSRGRGRCSRGGRGGSGALLGRSVSAVLLTTRQRDLLRR